MSGFRELLTAGTPVGVLVLGDSIARGDESSTPADSFIALWAEQLNLRYGSRIAVTNLSQGGNTCEDAAKMQRIRRNPDTLVVVAVGMNDAAWRPNRKPKIPLRKFAQIVGRIAATAERADSDVILVTPCVPAPVYADVEPYAQALRDLARERGLILADVTAAWRERGSPELLRNRINHPDDEGHRLYADCLLVATLASLAPGPFVDASRT